MIRNEIPGGRRNIKVVANGKSDRCHAQQTKSIPSPPVSIRNPESAISNRNCCRTGASAAGGAGSLPTWFAGSTCKDMDRTPLWGLMQCRIEQVLAFELGRVARLLTPHRLQAR